MSLLKSAHGGNTREAAELLGISPEQLLDFSANINPLGMPASLKRAIVDNLDCAERYPDVDYAKLHAALADIIRFLPHGYLPETARLSRFSLWCKDLNHVMR